MKLYLGRQFGTRARNLSKEIKTVGCEFALWPAFTSPSSSATLKIFYDIRCLRFEEKRMYLGLLLFLLPPMSLQCGISTHTEIGYRCPLCDLPCLAIDLITHS